MTTEEIIEIAEKVYGECDWNDSALTHLEQFAELVAEHERERIYTEQLQLPEPKLTGKFSITSGQFKCTGCTGTWTNRDDAKHHLCKDYQ
jgi:hypothetical protein